MFGRLEAVDNETILWHLYLSVDRFVGTSCILWRNLLKRRSRSRPQYRLHADRTRQYGD